MPTQRFYGNSRRQVRRTRRKSANICGLVGASSGMAVNGAWPVGLTRRIPRRQPDSQHPAPAPPCADSRRRIQTLASQEGNFPVFEGTSLYSLRLDHNIGNESSPDVPRQCQPQHRRPASKSAARISLSDRTPTRALRSRLIATSPEFCRTRGRIGNNKVNEFRFQYARRGLSYFYNTQIPGGSDPAVNIPGFAYFGREPYSYIQRVEQRYQFTDNFSWTIGRHNTKFGVDVNYLPLTATFTVNYGGVYDFGTFSSASLGFVNPMPGTLPNFPDLSPCRPTAPAFPEISSRAWAVPAIPSTTMPIGLFWQDSWRVSPHVTLNYGVRYDVEIPPKFKPPQGLALPAYNLLGLQKGIQTDKNNFQPRIGMAWDPNGDGKTVVRASYGMFYDHPLLGLYFLGDASDGSSSGQLAFAGTSTCSGAGNPGNLNAIHDFPGSADRISPAQRILALPR